MEADIFTSEGETEKEKVVDLLRRVGTNLRQRRNIVNISAFSTLVLELQTMVSAETLVTARNATSHLRGV